MQLLVMRVWGHLFFQASQAEFHNKEADTGPSANLYPTVLPPISNE